MFFIKILYAILGTFLGIGILKYRKTVYEWTGRFYWAEKYIGSGGTVVVITLVGLWLIFVSIAYPFGVFDGLTRPSDSTPSSASVSDTTE